MKYLLVNTPYYIAESAPTLGIPTLMGIMEENGIDSEFMDLNLEFIKRYLSKDNISGYVDFLKNIYKNYKSSDYPEFLKEELERFSKKIPYVTAKLNYMKKYIDFHVRVLEDKKLFYDEILFVYSDRFIKETLNYFGLFDLYIANYFISDVNSFRSNEENVNFTLNVSEMKLYFDSGLFWLKDFYEEKITEILDKKPSIVGISINSEIQLFSGLLLAYMLKKRSDVYINIGGSFFGYYYRIIDNLKDILSEFCDSISINDNTVTVLQLVKYLEGENSIDNITNFIYKKDNEMKINLSNETRLISEWPYFSFKGYDLNEFFAPEVIMPIRASNSCYWGKCIFCHCSASPHKYNIKSVEKFVDEIEYLSKKYNTKYFCFWDNAFPPEYLNRFADLIKERNIEISYSMYARLEDTFSNELIDKVKESGCKQIYWGLDSASQRVLDYIKKGITIENVVRILKYASSAGICNCVYLILGHPTETPEEMKEAEKFASLYKEYIDVLLIVPSVVFLEGSVLFENRDYYRSLVKSTEEERKKQKDKIVKLHNYYRFSDLYISGTYGLLYLDKFGTKKLRQRIRLKEKIVANKHLCMLYIDIFRKIYSLKNFFKR